VKTIAIVAILNAKRNIECEFRGKIGQYGTRCRLVWSQAHLLDEIYIRATRFLLLKGF
jgi:hypothetical protein